MCFTMLIITLNSLARPSSKSQLSRSFSRYSPLARFSLLCWLSGAAVAPRSPNDEIFVPREQLVRCKARCVGVDSASGSGVLSTTSCLKGSRLKAVGACEERAVNLAGKIVASLSSSLGERAKLERSFVQSVASAEEMELKLRNCSISLSLYPGT